jgi:lipopolysaccharide/colanic/teichoic acid biosynthesis glycosyltransferase
MAANIDRSERLNRTSAAEVILFDKSAKSQARRKSATRDNWLDGEVLEMSGPLAATRPRAFPRGAEWAAAPDLDNGINGVAKRAFDMAVALMALVVLAPLLAIVALLIAIDSPGPVLFRQFRHGRDRRPFKIYKFRTMKVIDGDELRQAKAGDDRVTRLGALLRRSSLDELPQLLNVVLGQMSIVGPRPHAVRHDMIFERHLAEYRLRFRCKPGIIGLAQLSGARGEIRCRHDIVRRTKLDLLYQRRWTLLLDVRLLCLTPIQVLKDLFSGRSY